MSSSPANSIASCLSLASEVPSTSELPSEEAGEKRRRRGSKGPHRVGGLVEGKDERIVKAERPTMHTYTSFEAAFHLHPPPSPPPSPKPEGRGWWRG